MSGLLVTPRTRYHQCAPCATEAFGYVAQADPRFSKLDVNDPPPDADLIEFQSILTVNSTNWKAVVEAVANADKQLMFSTFQGAVNGMLQMTANFYTWLHAGGLGNNVLFLSHDADSCRMLWKFGLPCWVDELCPRGDELPEGTAGLCSDLIHLISWTWPALHACVHACTLHCCNSCLATVVEHMAHKKHLSTCSSSLKPQHA